VSSPEKNILSLEYRQQIKPSLQVCKLLWLSRDQGSSAASVSGLLKKATATSDAVLRIQEVDYGIALLEKQYTIAIGRNRKCQRDHMPPRRGGSLFYEAVSPTITAAADLKPGRPP
jgi:SpoU rRNA methylase family enzyme